MRIQGPKNISPSPSEKPGGKTSGPSDRSTAFARLLTTEETPPAPASASGVRPVSSLNPLLTVDPIGDEPRRRRHNRKRAEAILDRLDAIRHGLLFGTIPGETLLALTEQLAVAREATVDAELLEILDEIDLRAQVELAKLEMERQAMDVAKKGKR